MPKRVLIAIAVATVAMSAGAMTPARARNDSPEVEVEEHHIDVNAHGLGAQGVASWDKGLVVLADHEVLSTRSRNGKGTWTITKPQGIDTDKVTDIAGSGSVLVAVGYDSEENDQEGTQYAPRAWMSTDAEHWTDVSSTVPVPADRQASVHAATADGDGFLAGGALYGGPTAEEGGRRVGAGLWHSDDGATWTLVDAPGLDDASQYSYQQVTSLATNGERQLSAQSGQCDGCDDDDLFLLFRTDDGTAWSEVDATRQGLEALDQANADVLAKVVAVGDGFAAVALDRDRNLGVWTSADGEEWSEGPGAFEAGETSPDAVTATGPKTAVAVAVQKNGSLRVWRIRSV